MKNSLRFLVLAALVALPVAGRAQPTYTNPDSSIGTLALGSSSFTAVQTFSGFSNISSMTWSVTNTGGGAATTTFNAYIAQWSGNTAVGSTLQAFQTGGVTLTNIGAGSTTNLTFTDTWTSVTPLNPALTYALVLSYASGATSFVANIGTNPSDAFFGSGGAGSSATSSNQGSFQTFLEGAGTNIGSAINSGQAYTMSIDTGGASPTPVPEPKTAAAGIAALFVAALVGRRVMLRRKQATAPLAA